MPQFEKTHGLSQSREYQTWMRMKARCYTTHHPDYPDYGARGIVVCDRWLQSLEAFVSDMGPRPPGMSIERKDNNGPYSPENCVWATASRQARNRRSSQTFTLAGETLTVEEWSQRTGIKPCALYWRLHHGWTAERALTEPTAPTYTHAGLTLTLAEWAKRSGIKKATLWARLHRGLPFDLAIRT